ncbi:MAG TPA: serine hydrolase [Dinghuibacter sp.]|uniref:serine hydrolase n=1 Tax=Dinghuibacter sp. TaxID=2024697 RepID=UPI002C0B1262|nr:serine hydrolase [Dinghuibacter sp.]HTJ13330.1 serine hydrolase [Dinghuibacter sp.]
MRITFLLLFAALHATAQTDTTFLKSVPGWMADNHVPCVGIGLIDHDTIRLLRTFGDLRQGRPAPANTLFNIASQTKPVTAMLTLRLVQAGLWNLDEPLMHYWIDPDIAGDSNLPRLTTRIVLSHQTGFPNWRTDNGGQKLRFTFQPGTRFRYSGEGFEYLRRALEHKFHQSLEVLMENYLFRPLGMNDTHYWSSRLDTGRFAWWHDGQGRPYDVSIQTPVNAADDLITTVADYCKLGIAAMKGLGLSDTLFQDMTHPQVKIKENYFRGLGWGLVGGLPGDEYALEHGGSDVGVRTMAVFLPKSGTGVVVMTNGDNGLFISDQVIKAALASGTQLLAIMNKSAVSHVRVVVPDSAIQAHVGAYIQSNGKVINIAREGNAIKVSGDGAPTAVLYPESANRFFMDGYDVQLEFPNDTTLVIYEGGKAVMTIPRRKEAEQGRSDLEKDMTALASDDTEGRFTASSGYLKAARYVMDELRQAGIPARLQPVPFVWDDYTGSRLTVGGITYADTSFVVIQRGRLRPTHWILQKPGDTATDKTAGIILLPNAGQAADWATTVLRQYRFGYMHYRPDGMPAANGVPVILVSPTLAGHLGGPVTAAITWKPENRTGYNVLGYCQGKTDRKIVLSAHLDHIGRIGNTIYNGANDDASGCAAVLGVARRLATQSADAAVVLAFFCGEELNLKGSSWFVSQLGDTAVQLNINVEQVGSRHRSVKGVWALGATAYKNAFLTAGSMFDNGDLQFSAEDSVRDILANTDGYSFMQRRIPSLLIGSGGFDEHHTPQDTIDLIDFGHLQKVTDLLYELVRRAE